MLPEMLNKLTGVDTKEGLVEVYMELSNNLLNLFKPKGRGQKERALGRFGLVLWANRGKKEQAIQEKFSALAKLMTNTPIKQRIENLKIRHAVQSGSSEGNLLMNWNARVRQTPWRK